MLTHRGAAVFPAPLLRLPGQREHPRLHVRLPRLQAHHLQLGSRGIETFLESASLALQLGVEIRELLLEGADRLLDAADVLPLLDGAANASGGCSGGGEWRAAAAEEHA